MDRQKKIKLLQDIAEGKTAIRDLAGTHVYVLDLDKITTLDEQEISIDEFCKRFNSEKDMLIRVTHTAFNLPEKYGNTDPAGSILQQIIEKRPDLDCQKFQEYIKYCKDLTACESYRQINEL